MADIVDTIAARLEVTLGNYVTNFEKASAAHERFTRTRPDKAGSFSTAEIQQYSDRHKQAGDTVAAASEKVSRAVKKRSTDEIAADRAAVAAATQAAREKAAAAKQAADAEIREAQRSARLRAVADRAVSRSGIVAATGGRIGAIVPREGTGQRSIPASVLNGAASEVTAEAEVNHLLADQAVLRGKLGSLEGAEKRAVQDRLAELRLEQSLRKAGLDDEAILLRLEERRALITTERAAAEKRQGHAGLSNVNQFALQASGGRVGYSFAPGAIAGLATAVGVGVGVQVIQSAVEYGKALDDLSKQLGITVGDLQAYEKIARDTGVETTTLSSAFGQFASNLGRAQQGGEEQAKVFKALGVDIKNFSSAGDALPTVIDRISQLKDPLQRAAIETRLFGEEGRKLDPLLSGGAARVSELAASLQETGRALSAKEIQELDETARKLSEVKNQLQVDFARIVAGNADAIIGLANSFATLVERIGGAITKLQQFSAEQIRAGRLPGDPAEARRFQLSYEAGRSKLFAENTAALQRNAQDFRILPADERLYAAQAPGSPRKTVAQLKREQLARANAPLITQRREIVSAARQAIADREPATPVQTGTVNQGLISRLGAPKGPKGKSAEQIEREAEQRTRQFNDQLASATAEYLRAQQQMTGSVEARAKIEADLLETAYKARLADIESQRKRNVLAGADAKIENARAAELVAAEKKARDANLAAIEQDKRLDKERALTAATQSLLEAQAGVISVQIAMARTTKERRDAQLKLLDNQQAQETNRLAGIINSSKPGDPAATQALVDFGRLQQGYDAQRKGVLYDTRSAGEQYRDSLPRTADQINEALDSVKVRGLASLDDAITDSISKVFKLGGAFGSVANSIISDLIRIGVQRAIIGPLADTLFGKEGGAGGSGSVGGFLKSIGSLIKGTRAGGGNVVGGNSYLVGERGPEIVSFGSSGRVYPNGALPSIAGSSPSMVVVQPIHADFRGARTDEQTMRQFMDYADKRSAQAYREAVATAGKQAPGIIGAFNTLKR